MKKTNKTAAERLYKAILSLTTIEECRHFFEDVCTIQEMQSMAQRFDVACQLSRDKSYADVNLSTGASTATICRVGKCLHYGSGGYRTVIKRLEKEGE